ncbi:hypothetical protein, partial [Pseudomonas sp. SWRI179]|uniref:hypothetical protein n=1 Tax=Pseudomonas sp. SWRI179 TaxID=2745497 RepID=UPI001EE38E49
LLNSLNLKEFSVSTAPEVGRIIDFQNLPSTPILTILSYQPKSPVNTEAGAQGRRPLHFQLQAGESEL